MQNQNQEFGWEPPREPAARPVSGAARPGLRCAACLFGLLLAIGGCGPGRPPPAVVPPPGVPELAGIHGRLPPAPGRSAFEDLTTVVVYADPLGASAPPTDEPGPATIRRRDESFEPALAVVAVGQAIHLRDEGQLFHRIFSYSEPNDFDLGVVGGSEVQSLVFHEPGLVRFYCSLHAWEQGAIFVAPSRHFATATPGGEYELPGLPPGAYRIGTWSELFSDSSLEITVEAGEKASVELPPLQPRGPE